MDDTPKPRPVINMARIHAYKAGIFQLFDVPVGEARKMRTYLLSAGFVITHTELV